MKKIVVFIISFTCMLVLLVLPAHFCQIKGIGPLSWSEIINDEIWIDCIIAVIFGVYVTFDLSDHFKKK